MWSEKHRPKSLDQLLGNEESKTKILLLLRKWRRGSRALLLIGPPGTGKTTAVHLAAEKLGLQLVELNASDTRTKDKLSKRIGEVIGSESLFGTRSLIFLDEVDGLAGRADYGAIDFIKSAVRGSENPVVMAANDPASDEVKKLASVTNVLEFRKPDPEEIEKLLRVMAEEEGIKVGREEMAAIVGASNGDVRSAINLLQSGLTTSKDEELTAPQAINAFFDSSDQKGALKALRAYPGQPREKVRDLFTAVVKSRVHEERRAEALEVLSRADLVMGRIMSGGDWRLLRYLDPMLASELRSSLGDGGPRYTQDATPWPMLLRIWNDSRKLKDIGSLVGKRLGISQRGSLVEDVPYLVILCRDKEFRDGVVKSLGLGENYADFLAKEASRSRRA
jgi:replication factor C large subunit